MSITIALAGNPNCGKTTMFNALTGSNQFVGNWPGVTVEKKEGRLKGHKDVSTVSYTHLDVYKRQFLTSRTAARSFKSSSTRWKHPGSEPRKP